jgi:hypothetical protein
LPSFPENGVFGKNMPGLTIPPWFDWRSFLVTFFASRFNRDRQLCDQVKKADRHQTRGKHRRPQETKVGMPIHHEEYRAAKKEAVAPCSHAACMVPENKTV